MIAYMLFDSSDCPAGHIDSFNGLTAFWRKSWEAVWEELRVQKNMGGDELLRHRFIAGVFHEGEAVCFQAYSTHNMHLTETGNHPYFLALPPAAITALRHKGYHRIATMEYLIAARDSELKQVFGAPLGTLMIGLACRLLTESLPIDAIVTVTRNNRSVNKTCSQFGAYSLLADLPLNNVEVDFMTFEPAKICSHPDPKITQAIDHLWKQKQDLRGASAFFKSPRLDSNGEPNEFTERNNRSKFPIHARA